MGKLNHNKPVFITMKQRLIPRTFMSQFFDFMRNDFKDKDHVSGDISLSFKYETCWGKYDHFRYNGNFLFSKPVQVTDSVVSTCRKA